MTKRNITYIEIPTRNGSESAQFYEALFGWKMTPLEGMDYILWDAGEGPSGGFNPVNTDYGPGDISINVNSDDIEADLKQAAALGGSIVHEKTEIPGFGWFGIFKDVAGNRISLYQQLKNQA